MLGAFSVPLGCDMTTCLLLLQCCSCVCSTFFFRFFCIAPGAKRHEILFQKTPRTRKRPSVPFYSCTNHNAPEGRTVHTNSIITVVACPDIEYSVPVLLAAMLCGLYQVLCTASALQIYAPRPFKPRQQYQPRLLN